MGPGLFNSRIEIWSFLLISTRIIDPLSVSPAFLHEAQWAIQLLYLCYQEYIIEEGECATQV